MIGVTGATGFIGSYLSRRLLDRGHGPLRLLVRRGVVSSAEEPAEVMQGDLLSSTDCDRFVAGLDVICYLAHVNSPVTSEADPAGDAAKNLGPLLNLLRAVERAGRKPHVLYFSSGGAIYEPNPARVPYRESDPCAPLSPYGIQKLAAEHYLRLAVQKNHLSATILRVGNAYGTLLPSFRLQGLIGVAVNSTLHGRPVRVFGSLENVRDYIHLEEIGAFIEIALKPRRPFTVVNIGSGVGYSVREVLAMIAEVSGKRLEIEVEDRLGGGLVDWVVLDIGKAHREFGWTPTIDLRAGIEGMLARRDPEPAASAATAR